MLKKLLENVATTMKEVLTWKNVKMIPIPLKDINGAVEEMDALGDIGLTVRLNEMQVLTASESIWEYLGATGEFYIITSILDGSGNEFEHKTKYFEGLKTNDFFPLGDGGMLLTYLKNPKWFIDFHMLIMESDADLQNLGKLIDDAKKEAKLDEVMKFIGTAAAFDPTMISQVITGVDLFLTVLSTMLQNNKDDHVATIHDFYLKHQCYGAGRHPKTELKQFQDVKAAYTIDIEKL